MQFIDLKTQYALLKRDIDARIQGVLDAQAFIQGPEVRELEAALAEFSGAKRVVTCANGTDALQLALMALGVGPGDAVYVPGFTYTATAEVILLLGARPVFVDSDPETFNIHRPKIDHLSFGYGIHFCLGASLARMEARIVMETLLKHLPNAKLMPGTMMWQERVQFRGPGRLLIEG